MNETICAVSTPPGRGGIAIVRVSGKGALEIAQRVWAGKPLKDVVSHSAHFGNVVDADGSVLDQAVATVFRGPHSFTGEDVVEYSVHGSLYVQKTLLEALVRNGARIASPGEFTRRAFVNGRLDLAEAEAVADVIASSSKAAHALAVSQLQGRFSSHIKSLRDKLVDLAALLELELDFSEEDVTFADRGRLVELARAIVAHVSKLISTFSSGRAICEGVPVAIVGRPNAGKSSLLNALLGIDRAIVSDIPGTTRDTIEDSADIGGITFRFIDTAGLRTTKDPVESLGIERAYASLSSARIILWLVDPDLTKDEAEQTLESFNTSKSSDSKIVILHSKSDLLSKKAGLNGIALSVKTGEGIDELRKKLYEIAAEGLPSDESLIVTNARHHAALMEANESLQMLIDGMDILTTDLLAEHLRGAISSLSAITGEITSDTVLHTIFSRFCIGK